MEIKDPVIDLYYTYLGPGASENIPTREEIYRQMIGEMEIELDSIRITNAKIRTMSLKTGKPIMESEKVDISFKDVKMNKEGLADKSRYFFSRSFAFKARIIHWFSKNKLYKYDAKNLTIHSDSNDLHLQEFSINPLLDENGFAYALPFQDDRYDFTFSDLRVRNFDPGALLDENLRGDELMIRSAKLYIYRDLHRPRDEKNRVGHYPHQVINRTPFHFTLKRISLPEFYLEYKEKSALTGKTGRVQFYGASVSIANFTNDSASVAINNIMTADANSRFLNKTPLITHWTFYLMNPTGKFEVKGSAGPINGYDLNPLLEPMGPARIEKGHFSGLQFAFTGNNHTMNGTVQLLYEDLKVALLEKDPAKKKIKKVFSSFFANLLIKNDNPKKREAPRVAQVNSNRDPNRSFFSFCWRSVFKGMQQCAGISQ